MFPLNINPVTNKPFVYDIIHALGVTASRLEKEAILLEHRDHEELKETFRLALHPTLNFYIKKIPSYQYDVSNDLDSTLTFAYSKVVEMLSTRTVTGNDAIKYLASLLSQLHPQDARVLELVIDRNLRCGVQASTVNKIWPGLVNEFPVMLASKPSDIKPDSVVFPVYIQRKADGMRIQILTENDGTRRLYTRNGKELDLHGVFDMTGTTGEPFTRFVLDGEMVVIRDGKVLPRTVGNGICNKAVKGTISREEADQLVVIVWDAIDRTCWDKGESDTTTYRARLANLKELQPHFGSKILMTKTKTAYSWDEVQVHYRSARADGDEGVMVKEWSGIWENKRSRSQIKFKGIYDADLYCYDWIPGTGKNTGKIGALSFMTADGKMRVNVGTGFSDKDREANPKTYIGQIGTIQFNDIVKDKRSDTYSLFLPRLVECPRLDKETADNLDELLAQIKEE